MAKLEMEEALYETCFCLGRTGGIQRVDFSPQSKAVMGEVNPTKGAGAAGGAESGVELVWGGREGMRHDRGCSALAQGNQTVLLRR